MRDEEFWFKDGTVTLVAGNTEFKVYKGILETHSPVFADMFSLPQPRNSAIVTRHSEAVSNTSDVVHLDDSPEDLRHILRALMPNTSARYVFPLVHTIGRSILTFSIRADDRFLCPEPSDERSAPSFYQVSAYARIGHKYQMDHLVDQSIAYLKSVFTNDLDKWRKRVRVEVWGCVHRLPWNEPAAAIAAVNISRLVGCPSILPTALLVCCSLNARLIQGFKREDGTRETLNKDDFTRCFLARPKLVKESVAIVLSTLARVKDNLPFSHSKCHTAGEDLLNTIQSEELITALDPFWSWYSCISDFRDYRDICASCQSFLEQQFQKDQAGSWSDLPEIFDIEVTGWPC